MISLFKSLLKHVACVTEAGMLRYYYYDSTRVLKLFYFTHQLFSCSHSIEKIERTVQIEASTVEIEERGVKLRLTVVDTPGYGDAINSQDWCVCMLWRSDM